MKIVLDTLRHSDIFIIWIKQKAKRQNILDIVVFAEKNLKLLQHGLYIVLKNANLNSIVIRKEES